MKVTSHFILVVLIGLSQIQSAFSENWPTWRGPNGNGTTSKTNLPIIWSSTENVLWKVKLPESGNSTPIVWNNKIFLTQAIHDQRSLLCFDSNNGSLLWQKSIQYTQKEPTHKTNPYCSASPVTDGTRVIVWYGSAGVYCYDMDGNKLWEKQLGDVNHMWGYAASPIIEGDNCFIHFGPGENHFLVALNKHTGEIVWKDIYPFEPLVDKEDNADIPISEKLRGSWSTPLLIELEGETQLVNSIPQKIIAYNPKNGEQLWLSKGVGDLVYASPIWGENTIVALGGFYTPSVAFTLNKEEGQTTINRLWRKDRTRLRLGNGVIHDGYLYIHYMGGIAECVDLQTGDTIWRERLAGKNGSNESWSSMILSGDNIYLNNKSGDTFIFKANPTFQLVASNSVEENTNSSLAISGNNLILRTFEHLWCIGNNLQ